MVTHGCHVPVSEHGGCIVILRVKFIQFKKQSKVFFELVAA